MSVIDISQARIEREPHRSGPCKCLHCQHEWQAVVPKSADQPFECPECGLMRGVWNALFGAGEDQQFFECNHCYSVHFMILRTNVVCVGCGTTTSFAELADMP